MTINLLHALSGFKSSTDRDGETAFFMTHVPWIAPEAYFHIIFKPAPSAALTDLSSRLRMPESLVALLRTQNGADLFSGAVGIHGIHGPGQLLNRRHPFARLPFNIESENQDWPPFDRDRFLSFGGYGFDGSRVCIDRNDSTVHVLKRDVQTLSENSSYSWSSVESWLQSEIARLSVLFDKNGRILVKRSETIPSAQTISVKPS